MFTHTELQNARQPHPVLSLACACAAVERAQPATDEPSPDKSPPLAAELPPEVKAKVLAAMRALGGLK